jgi:hypothetical protein
MNIKKIKKIRYYWNELVELSFRANLLGEELIKGVEEPEEPINEEFIASQREIDLAEELLSAIASNLQLLTEALKLNLKLHPFSDLDIHPYIYTLMDEDLYFDEYLDEGLEDEGLEEFEEK